MIREAPRWSYMKIQIQFDGFDKEVKMIIQPKDKWINHLHNNEDSITKVWDAENGVTYFVPIDNDVLINFAPISSKSGKTTDAGMIYVSA